MRKSAILRTGMLALLFIGALAVFAARGNASSENAIWPVSSGEVVYNNGKLEVDASHSDEGYVMVRTSSPSSKRMKVRVVFEGAQLTYDLNSSGEYETFPLQLGSGNYELSLYENASGNKYSAQGKVSLTAQLKDENAAFLVPNQYVNYVITSLPVPKSDELTEGMTDAEAYQAVCDFMAQNFTYDFVRAMTISPGTLPEIDPCFEKQSGICQDLAAVMVCMLRVQGIPAKLMIGYADKNYHAWTVAVVDGKEIFFDPTVAVNALQAKTYTQERFY